MTKITKESFISALKGTGGVKTAIAQNLTVTFQGLERYLKKHPEMEQYRLDERKKQVERAELLIFQEVGKGNLKAGMFVLERLGKSEGWAQKVESESNVNLKGGLTKEEFKKIVTGNDA